MKNKNLKKGFSIVEVLLAMAIFTIFATGIFYLSLDTIQRDTKINLNTEALLYAKEGIEAVRNIRDKDYLLLTNGDYGLYLNAGNWEFIAAPEDINGFYERTITIEDVYRNELGEIDTEGTYLDPETKKITSEVVWYQKGIIPKSVSLVTYLSNWTGDDWIQTTCDEFNGGAFENTEVTLTTSPPDNNCGVVLTTSEVGSTFFSSVNVGKHGTDVDVEGNYAYLAVNNVSKGLAIINVSNPSSPVITKEINIGQKGRYVEKEGNYVHMGVQSWLLGWAMVNVSNPSTAYWYFSWPMGGYGNKPTVSGDTLFMGINTDYWAFQVYDISGGLLPFPLLMDMYNFNSAVHVIELNGNYAYVGTDEDDEGLIVMNVSNPYNVTEVSSLDVGEEVNAITFLGSLAFIATEESTNSLHVVDISNPANPEILTSLNVGGEIQDLVISGNYLYAAVDTVGSGLAAVNISNPFSPYLVYNMDVQGKGTGIDADTNYVYVSTDTSNKGLVIVGTTIAEIIDNGTYTSQVFDTLSADTRYNFIEWDYQEVTGSSVSFQIRTADTEGNLASATWVGPDGTNATYYENPRTTIMLDPSRTGQRYCQFKAFINSDGASTPIIESVKINYTP